MRHGLGEYSVYRHITSAFVCAPLVAHSAIPDEPNNSIAERTASVITITGNRLGSLPTVLPTTIESTTGEQVRQKINATDSQDALKYFPSLLVRKRYAGDYDHAVLSTRASGTGNSARSLVYADGILLSNLLGNGASFTPRWGLVAAEEIERVDVLYGPFSAAYPGNSVGAVVDYVTRMPKRLELHAMVGASGQRFRYGGTDGVFRGGQGSASLGSSAGDFAWWVNVSRLDSRSHPLVFATRAPSATAAEPGTPQVNGAVRQRNRFNQDWLLLGASNLVDTTQDHAKLKLAYRIGEVQLRYTLGFWDNTVQRTPQTWLRDAEGQAVDVNPNNFASLPGGTRNVNIDGQAYGLMAADFGRTRELLTHRIQSLSLKQAGDGLFSWEATASAYDYLRDEVRAWAPVVESAAARAQPLAGRMTNLAGTGWYTLAAKGTWRTGEGWISEAGLQHDAHGLRNRVSATSEWTEGTAEGAALSRFEGDTSLTSVWAQQVLPVASEWRAVAGLRAERWQAHNGLTANGGASFEHPERSQTEYSPKLALAWSPHDEWAFKLATGRAWRFPTVSELFQGGLSASTGALQNGNPDLRPERSQTTELSAEWSGERARARATVFHERTHDALYSQTNTTVTPIITNVQNVDRIRTLGLELAASANWWGAASDFSLTGSVTYADSVIQANANFPASVGKLQPRVPRWRASVLGTWSPHDAFSATLGVRHAGRQFNTLDNTDPNGAVYQGVSDFVVADVRAIWKPAPHWRVALGVDNLNNATYWNFHPYPQRTWFAELRFDL
jgi:iron complex outermembrane recepter protein